MIKVNVMYPVTSGARFDLDYYCSTHIPMVIERLGEACLGVSVERGIGGAVPGSDPRFAAVAGLRFESIKAFEESFGPVAQEVMADIKNFTDIEPWVEIADVCFEKGAVI